jgi:hypothetical protein
MPPQKRKPVPSQSGGSKHAGKHKKVKQPPQRPPQQRIKVLGANGKIRFEWRDW